MSSKRVSKLSRRYHCRKKRLRQSAMMAEVLSDVWVCPKCLFENQDYQRCMGPECDELRLGGMFGTSDFALSPQLPSSGCRTTICVAMNHHAAAARGGRVNRRNPPLLDKSQRGLPQRPMLMQTLPSSLASIVTRGVVSRLVLLHNFLLLLLMPPGRVWLLIICLQPSPQARIAVATGGGGGGG